MGNGRNTRSSSLRAGNINSYDTKALIKLISITTFEPTYFSVSQKAKTFTEQVSLLNRLSTTIYEVLNCGSFLLLN